MGRLIYFAFKTNLTGMFAHIGNTFHRPALHLGLTIRADLSHELLTGTAGVTS